MAPNPFVVKGHMHNYGTHPNPSWEQVDARVGDLSKRALDNPCPTCKAEPGEPCRTKTGKPVRISDGCWPSSVIREHLKRHR